MSFRFCVLLLCSLFVTSACSESGSGGVTPPLNELDVHYDTLGYTAHSASRGPGYLAFLVLEDSQGEDLNGDGDLEDSLPFVRFHATGETLSLRSTTRGALYIAGAAQDAIVFLASEFDSGEDLNGDGDIIDDVLHVYRTETRVLHNTGLGVPHEVQEGVYEPYPEPFLTLEGDTLVFLVNESQNNDDINGDGDIDDSLVHFYDFTSNLVTVTKTEAFLHRRLLSEGTLLCGTWEKGVDLNGDEDGDDYVLTRIDYENGVYRTMEYGLALDRPFFPNVIAEGEGFSLVTLSEYHQGETDLNDDGDAIDRILHTYIAKSDQLTNTFISMPVFPRVLVEGRFALFTLEDGELMIFDADRGVVRSSGLHPWSIRGSMDLFGGGPPEGYVTVWLDEMIEKIDYNEDGDLEDRLPHLFDLERDRLINLGYPGDLVSFDPDNVYLHAIEQDPLMGGDFNGDGDEEDVVIFRVDLETTDLELLPIEGFLFARMGQGVLALTRRENEEDWNEDGDHEDHILFFYRHSDRSELNTRLAGRPGGVGDFGSDPLPVRVSEADFGDLNGDGDEDLSTLILVHLEDL